MIVTYKLKFSKGFKGSEGIDWFEIFHFSIDDFSLWVFVDKYGKRKKF